MQCWGPRAHNPLIERMLLPLGLRSVRVAGVSTVTRVRRAETQRRQEATANTPLRIHSWAFQYASP